MCVGGGGNLEEGGKLRLTTGKELLQPELRRESGVAYRGGVALNYLPARLKRRCDQISRKGFEQAGRGLLWKGAGCKWNKDLSGKGPGWALYTAL